MTGRRRRAVAAGLAALVAVTQLVLFVLAQRQLTGPLSAVVVTPGAETPRWVMAGAWAAPWLVATILFAVGATRRAVAVALTSAALVTTTGLGSFGALTTAPPDTSSVTGWATTFGGTAAWCLAVAAGVVAWSARPRRGWRDDAPGPVGGYVTVAVLAWLPTAFLTTQFAPPGAPRAFARTAVSQLDGLDAVASLAASVVVGMVLFVAPRLRRDVAGTVVLTYAIPALIGLGGEAFRVVNEAAVIITPPGVLGGVGVLGLLVVGARWSPQRASAPVDR